MIEAITPRFAQSKLDALTLPQRWVTIFKHGHIELEYYKPLDTDPQKPHTRDEVYFVYSGAGEFFNGTTRERIAPGDVLFVPAHVEHRFERFTDDLVVWVMFYGPEGGEVDMGAAP